MTDQARWAATKFANANARLQDNLGRNELSAIGKERVRISRDIHDTVGYSLTGLIAQVRTVQAHHALGEPIPPEFLKEMETTIVHTLQDIRTVVHELRDERRMKLAWQIQWRQLCDNFSDCTGMGITLNLPDDIGAVSDSAGSVIYRLIQESLTNAVRHGRATFTDITMLRRPEPERLLVRISDNGIGSRKGLSEGNGLKGMRERAGP